MIKQLKEDTLLLLDHVKNDLIKFGLLKRGETKYRYYKTREGIRFRLRQMSGDATVIMETFWLNEYMRNQEITNNNGVVIDVGAHIGSFSLLASSKANNSKVFAFEPHPDNFKLLKKNIRLNNLEDKIFPSQVALAKKSKKRVKLYLHPHSSGMHSTILRNSKSCNREDDAFIEAKAISLGDVFKKNKISRCNFLKMDCEGSEYEVMLSTPKSILKRIDNIALEYHDGGDIQKIKKHLEQAGFMTRFDNCLNNVLLRHMVNIPLLFAWRQKQ